MNINFQTITGQKTSQDQSAIGFDAMTARHPKIQGPSVNKTMGYAVDLDRSGFTDNAYNNPTRSMDDIAEMAQNTDVSLQHNYMALLSNTVSEEDYGRAMEEGFDIKDMDSREAVTIVDKIKSVLLESGVEVAGYNDDLSSEKLARITGSVTFANELKDSFHENDIPLTPENVKASKTAFEQIEDIKSLDDSAVKFMVLNNMAPTMENVYFAAHSTNGLNTTGRGFYAQETAGYYAQTADMADFEKLAPQIDRVIEEAGFDPEDADIRDNSKWMVTQGIPLTPENLQKVNTIRKISFPVSEKLAAKAAASAIADGKKPIEGNLVEPKSNLQKAAEIVRQVKEISDDDLKSTVDSGKDLNIRNLVQAKDSAAQDGSKQNVKAETISLAEARVANTPLPRVNAAHTPESEVRDVNATMQESIPEGSKKLIQARLQLEEVRLRMTTEANKQLLDSGFSIDTAPMEELIERLKGAIGMIGDETAGRIVDEATDVTPQNSAMVFSMTMSRVSVIRQAPADLVGEMADELESATLSEISTRAETMTSRFRQAGEGYEKLMTAPRADLGDSIKKAFRNVDEILKDMGRELSEENRRAVRILGYNRMEITGENFEKVRSLDARLQVTVSRLKPGAVMDMIREGKNPLSMTIEELSQNLDHNSSSDREKKGKDEERYAKFLYKLEHKGEISQEEKKSFIGIYRLFHTLKAGDYQAIGSLLKTDQKMTLGNLLNATRSQKAAMRGMDYSVDDSFGGFAEKTSEGSLRIDEQIGAAFRYYRSKAQIVYDNLEPEKLHAARPTNETLLQDLADDLQREDIDQQLEKAYVKEQVRQIRQTASLRATETAFDELKAVDIGVTYNNLEAMISVRRDRRQGNIWDRLRDYKEVKELSDELDSEGYEDNYVKILGNISDKLSEELMNESDSYIDVRSIALLQKQLSVMGKSAESDSFEVPVEVEGETLSMHVTLKTEKNSVSRMDASVQTIEYGQIAVSLYVEGDAVRGMLTTTGGRSQEQAEYLEKVRTRLCVGLKEKMEDLGVDQENIAVLYNTQGIPAGRGQVSSRAMEGAAVEKTKTHTLLKMAKAFVEALQ